jgi:hypothetical protein
MMEDGLELMRQINAHSDAAKRAKPKLADFRAFAAVLAGHFNEREEDDILRQCKEVWWARSPFWID